MSLCVSKVSRPERVDSWGERGTRAAPYCWCCEVLVGGRLSPAPMRKSVSPGRSGPTGWIPHRHRHVPLLHPTRPSPAQAPSERAQPRPLRPSAGRRSPAPRPRRGTVAGSGRRGHGGNGAQPGPSRARAAASGQVPQARGALSPVSAYCCHGSRLIRPSFQRPGVVSPQAVPTSFSLRLALPLLDFLLPSPL